MAESTVSKQKEQFRRLVEDAIEVALRRINPDEEALERLLSRKSEFKDHVVSGIRRLAAEDPIYDAVRSILGEDFISPDEVMRARKGVVYSEGQLRYFAETTPPESVLTWCKENSYMLVPGPHKSLSLLDVRNLDARYFSVHSGWLEKHALRSRDSVFRDTVRSSWIALRKDPIPDSLGKSFLEQVPLLSNEESVPNAAEFAWCITTYKAVKGVFLVPRVYVRTSSTYESQTRISFGDFGLRDFGSQNDGLNLYTWTDEHRSDFVGLSPKRR